MNRCENDAIITDYGAQPFIVNIDRMAKGNLNFRTAMWTGENLQVTLMSIPVGGEIGLEMHHELDQFLRIAVSYTHLTLPTRACRCRSRWSPYH